MDKYTLKKHVLVIAEAFKTDGRPLELMGIIPLIKDLPTTSYVLQVHSSWLNSLPSGDLAIQTVISKLYELLPKTALRYINRVEICRSNGDIHCIADDLIINQLNYLPALVPYDYLDS